MLFIFNHKTFHLDIPPLQSFFSIRQTLQKKLKLKQISLLFNGSPLDDKKTPIHYQLSPNSTITILPKVQAGSVGRSLLIFLFVLILLLFLILIILGVLPFISFIITNIIIKGLTFGVSFLRNLTDTNNWFNSFLYMIQNTFIPFIGFILNYFGMFLVIYFVTFFSTYYLYYFKWNDTCQAQKTSMTLSIIIALLICGIFFLADLPQIIFKIASTFSPSFLKDLFLKISQGLQNAKLKFFTFLGPLGLLEQKFITLMSNFFEKLNKMKEMDVQLLYNWANTYQQTKLYPLSEQIKEMGLTDILAYMNYAELQKDCKTDPDIPILSLKDSSYASFMRWFYDTLLYFGLKIVDIFEICPRKNNSITRTMMEMEQIEKLKKSAEKTLADPTITGQLRTDLAKSYKNLVKILKNLSQLKEKQEEGQLLDIPCLAGILTDGAITSIFALLLFIILFLIFMFIKI